MKDKTNDLCDEILDDQNFQHVRDHGKKKRAGNREHSAIILTEAGVEFTSHNGGAHLIVQGKNCIIDFWPGTGKYVSRIGRRGGRGEGRGVRSLMKFCHTKENIRPSVMQFAMAMERKLRANDHKGGWEHMSVHDVYHSLNCEMMELRDAIRAGIAKEIRDEAADVANFAMMIFDNEGRRK